MAIDFAGRNNTRIHIHISESSKETEDNYEKHGVSPVEYLEKAGLFERPVYAAHCVHVSEKDLEIIRNQNIVPVHNPTSNLKLGNGFAPVPELLRKGIRPALGTDGASSNNNLNMFEEIHLAVIIHKGNTGDPTAVGTDGASSNNNLNMFEEIHLAVIIHKGNTGDPTAVPVYEALQMATINGAMAFGIDDVFGSLTPGKDADIIILDTNKTHLQPLHDPVAALVYGAQASDVHLTICAGKILIKSGEIQIFNEYETIRKSCNDARVLMGDQ